MSSAAQPDFAKYSSRRARNARTLRAYMALRNQEIAQRIKELREARGQPPQPIVAAAVGVSLRTYQNWEGGDAKPEYRNLESLAAYFGVSEEFILTGTERKPVPKEGTPDLFVGPDDISKRLDRIERMLEEAATERQAIRALLKEQEDILNEMRRVAGSFPDDDSIEHLTETMRDLADRAEADAKARAEDAATRAGTRRRRAGER